MLRFGVRGRKRMDPKYLMNERMSLMRLGRAAAH